MPAGSAGIRLRFAVQQQEAGVEEKMHWVPTAIGMTVLACIFGGIVIAIYPGFDALGDFLDKNVEINWDQNAPAWVQAIGSIVAIFSGFLVAERSVTKQHKKILEKEWEDKRQRQRVQYHVLSDRMTVCKQWSKSVLLALENHNLNAIKEHVVIGKSVRESIDSVGIEDIPAAEVVLRLNLASLCVAGVIVALNELVLKEKQLGLHSNAVDRVNHLFIISQVDQKYCFEKARELSTLEENKIFDDLYRDRSTQVEKLLNSPARK